MIERHKTLFLAVIASLSAVVNAFCAEETVSILDSVKEQLSEIETYEIKAEYTGTKMATGELIWRSKSHVFWQRPDNKHVFRLQSQGYIISEDFPMNLYGEELSVFDGKTQFRRSKTWGGEVEGTGPTTRRDNGFRIARGHHRGNRHGMAIDSLYVESIRRLVQTFEWDLKELTEDTAVLKGIYVPKDKDFAYPGYIVRQWRYVPGSPVTMVVDRRRSLVTEYRWGVRIITGNKPPGDVLCKIVFHEIRINPELDESMFTYTPAAGEVVHIEEDYEYSPEQIIRDRKWDEKNKDANNKVHLFPRGHKKVHDMGLFNLVGLPLYAAFTEEATQHAALLYNTHDLPIKDVHQTLATLSRTAHARIESATYGFSSPDIVVVLYSPDRLPTLMAYNLKNGLGFLESPLGKGYFKRLTKYTSKADSKLRPKAINLTDMSSLDFPQEWAAKTLREIFADEKPRQVVAYERSIDVSEKELWDRVHKLLSMNVRLKPIGKQGKELNKPSLVAALIIMESGAIFNIGILNDAVVVVSNKGRGVVNEAMWKATGPRGN